MSVGVSCESGGAASTSSAPQYCLKWNNHPVNISSVLERLRRCERFTDVTLASRDRKNIRCHRIVLSAGSGYLEDVLMDNPSDHPTIVLSQINFAELKLLVEFMYAGEVAVGQERLSKLLEAAKILKIKGLWEADASGDKDNEEENDEEEEEEESEDSKSECSTGAISKPGLLSLDGGLENARRPSAASTASISGSQKRKRKNPGRAEKEGLKVTTNNPISKIVTHAKKMPRLSSGPSKVAANPLYGVSNAYFLTQTGAKEDTTSKPKIKPGPASKTKTNSSQAENIDIKGFMSDLPSLLSQNQLHPTLASMSLPALGAFTSAASPATTSVATQAAASSQQLPLPPFLAEIAASVSAKMSSIPSPSVLTKDRDAGSTPSPLNSPQELLLQQQLLSPSQLLSSAPVRRYKQYTEDSLQQALRDIMDGQSINRSSMRFNIPARTLRDWMKRLNIKSVYTHQSGNSAKDRCRSVDGSSEGDDHDEEEPGDDDEDEEEEEELKLSEAEANQLRMSVLASARAGDVAFPGMRAPQKMNGAVPSKKTQMKSEVKKDNRIKSEDHEEDEEEEIDDDEEESLKIDERPEANEHGVSDA